MADHCLLAKLELRWPGMEDPQNPVPHLPFLWPDCPLYTTHSSLSLWFTVHGLLILLQYVEKEKEIPVLFSRQALPQSRLVHQGPQGTFFPPNFLICCLNRYDPVLPMWPVIFLFALLVPRTEV